MFFALSPFKRSASACFGWTGSASSSSDSYSWAYIYTGVLKIHCILGIFSIGFKVGLKITLVFDPSYLKFTGDSTQAVANYFLFGTFLCSQKDPTF